VLQCVAVCCSVLQRFDMCLFKVMCVAVRCSVLQCVAVCCSVSVEGKIAASVGSGVECCSVLQCVAVCCSVSV